MSALNEEEIKHLIERQIVITIPSTLKNNFPPFLSDFDVPSIIEFAIIDRNATSNYSIGKTLRWLDQLIVKFCQVRYYDTPAISEIQEILDETLTSNLESIEFLLPYNHELITFFEGNLSQFPKINHLVFHGAPENKNELEPNDKRRLFIKEVIPSSNSCGIVKPEYFSQTKKHVLKNINFNSCLYKKIGIDVDGAIKNCPSMKSKIGHVDDLESIEMANLETEFWYLKKDDIEICKDCEFRYICTDCRVNVVDGIKSRPSTCIYNPYTNLWKGQSGYEVPEKNN